jgi:hypothetical protein
MSTPPWPRTLPPTSSISCTPTLLPQEYCMLREVMSQNGYFSRASAPACGTVSFSQMPGKSVHLRQAAVLAELHVPPVDAVLVQAPAQFDADALEALLERHLEADALLASARERDTRTGARSAACAGRAA